MLNWRDPGNPKAGGAERVSQAYLGALVEKGREVFWFANDFPGGEPADAVRGITSSRRWQGHVDRESYSLVSPAESRSIWLSISITGSWSRPGGPGRTLLPTSMRFWDRSGRPFTPGRSTRSANGRNAGPIGCIARSLFGRPPSPPRKCCTVTAWRQVNVFADGTVGTRWPSWKA